ncbi:MAG: 5'/3'-nucleotidase SurE [Ignavibacteria bacterium]|nr:5'/3'-nucleotidase SurE [Ignavibacteria bacterium]
MNILVTNDDGIDSPGILALAQAMKEIGNVTVIAPDRQQSAVGHALTVSAPLRAVPFQRNGDMFGFAVNGTPADCVKLGVSTLLAIKPDLVVSGINHGANTAVNVMYSGTVSAATEAMMIGIPALAVSLTSFSPDADMSVAADYAKRVAGSMLEWGLQKDTILNMNVPAISREEVKGMRITRLSNSYWDDSYDSRKDPMGREYHWIVGTYRVPEEADIETDDGAVRNGWVSLTPVHYDLTHRKEVERLQSLI